MIIQIYKEDRYYNIKKRVDQSKIVNLKVIYIIIHKLILHAIRIKKVFLIYTIKHEKNMYKSIASCLLVSIDNKQKYLFFIKKECYFCILYSLVIILGSHIITVVPGFIILSFSSNCDGVVQSHICFTTSSGTLTHPC